MSGVVFDHVSIRVSDRGRSEACYATLLRTLAVEASQRGQDFVAWNDFRGAWATFSLLADGRAPTHGLHLAFPAPDRQTVVEFHRAVTGAGYRDNGEPGERPQYHPGYFAAYALDPDGTNVESVFHDRG